VLGAAGCARKPPVPRHLILVTIDTLRADRLGAYGNKDVATPHLDRIAAEGALAEQATAHVPLTRPSHVTLFTGLLPALTGVRDNISPAVLPQVPLLAETLQKAGFASGAFVSSVVLEPSSSGLDRGFDTYDATFPGSNGNDVQFLSTVQKKGNLTTAEAIAWLEGLKKPGGTLPRVFLWLHLYDPHDPYEPPEPYASRYRDRPYDGEVAFADELVGRLDDALGRLGMRDDSLLLVTSDHGEGLGEHDETLHGFFAYQSTLRIPFLVRGPGVKAGLRLTPTVRLVDVYPTVLDLLGLAPPPDAKLDGVSLAGRLRGGAPAAEPVVYAESLVPLLHFGWSDLRVVREGRWKYIQAPRPELYDLATDPGETTNLAAREPARSQALRGALGRFLDEERKITTQTAGGGTVPPELLEKLGALGYVGGAAPAETKTPGADPKDKIQEFRVANDLIRQGLLLFHEKDYGASADRFGAVLRRGISSFEVRFYLARCLLELGRARESIPHFAEAARLLPVQAAAWTGLADARAAAGDSKGAREALRKGQAVLPKDASLRLAEAHLLTALGRKTEARAAFEAALPLAPRNARALTAFGDLLRELGAVEEAVRRQREAVAIEPASAAAWNSLGMTLGGNGRATEAEQAFREATRLDAKNHRYAYNLGLILVRQGRGALARPFFESALALDPAFVPAREQLAALRPTRPR
jgi:arylsulfatase A-like enzyme/Flp pilus assembly protein TadD